MRSVVLATVVLAACGASVDGDDPGATVDGAPGDDGGPPPPDTAPACFNGRVVYLSFEGETLMRGTSSSQNNRASWMNKDTGTAPPYRVNDANRAAQITQIVDGIRAQLSSFPITVVTDRPATGEYMMIVYGGIDTDVGSNFGGAVQQLDCNDATTRNDVAWVADIVTGTQRIVNFSVGAIGFGLGLTATTDPLDCMCGWDNACNSDNSVACRLTEGIARDPQARQLCPGLTTQDETSTFRTAFCE